MTRPFLCLSGEDLSICICLVILLALFNEEGYDKWCVNHAKFLYHWLKWMEHFSYPCNSQVSLMMVWHLERVAYQNGMFANDLFTFVDLLPMQGPLEGIYARFIISCWERKCKLSKNSVTHIPWRRRGFQTCKLYNHAILEKSSNLI